MLQGIHLLVHWLWLGKHILIYPYLQQD